MRTFLITSQSLTSLNLDFKQEANPPLHKIAYIAEKK